LVEIYTILKLVESADFRKEYGEGVLGTSKNITGNGINNSKKPPGFFW